MKRRNFFGLLLTLATGLPLLAKKAKALPIKDACFDWSFLDKELERRNLGPVGELGPSGCPAGELGSPGLASWDDSCLYRANDIVRYADGSEYRCIKS